MKSLISHIFLILNPSICLQWNILISLELLILLLLLLLIYIFINIITGSLLKAYSTSKIEIMLVEV